MTNRLVVLSLGVLLAACGSSPATSSSSSTSSATSTATGSAGPTGGGNAGGSSAGAGSTGSVTSTSTSTTSTTGSASTTTAGSTTTTASSSGSTGTVGRPAWPQLQANSGYVLGGMTLVTLVASNDALPNELFAFSDALAGSDWYTQTTAEYGVTPIAQTVSYVGPAITTNPYTRADMVGYIQAAIASGGVPAPNGKTLYMMYLPDGITLGTTSDCGYHTSYPDAANTLGDGRAVVTRDCRPHHGETVLQSLTRIASHEVVEAATDPTLNSWNLGRQPAQPWSQPVWSSFAGDHGYVEDGDLCSGTRISLTVGDAGPLAFQRAWSNAAAAGGGDPCVPHLPIPFYNVTAPQDWYAGSPGQTIDVPLTGWSEAATANWLLYPAVINATPTMQAMRDGGLSLVTDLGIGTVAPCYDRLAINDSAHGVLSVTIPANAVSGDYAVLHVLSFREDATCYEPANEDAHHVWPIGFYVP